MHTLKKIAFCFFGLVFLLNPLAASGATLTNTSIRGGMHTEAPLELKDNFTDSASMVENDAAVKAALDKIPGKDFWVVLVKNYEDADGKRWEGEQWAKETFRRSQLDPHDGLLVISTGTSELSYWSGGGENGVTSKIIDRATNADVLELFSAGKWEAGIIKVTNNVAELYTRSADGGKMTPFFMVIVLAVVFGGGIYLWRRKKRKIAGGFLGQKSAEKNTEAQETLAELSQRASAALLRADDEVHAAQAELEFARAEFGVEDTQNYAAALHSAQKKIERGFALRTTLDDAYPETPEQQRQMNVEILALVESARSELEKQNLVVQELRKVTASVGEKASELKTRATELRAEIPVLEAEISYLKKSNASAAMEALLSYPTQIAALVEAAEKALQEADRYLQQEQRKEAVAYVQMANNSLGEAAKMRMRLKSAPEKLQQAAAELQANINSLTEDVEYAQKLDGNDRNIRQAQITAQAVLERAKSAEEELAASSHAVDLLELNEELRKAEIALDSALEEVRAEAEAKQRLQKHIANAAEQAKETIELAADYINRYRAEANAQARTLLVHAKNTYARASDAALDEQLPLYNSANAQAQKAMQVAEESVRAASEASSQDDGEDLGGILAGVLISSIANGIFNSRNFSSGFGGRFDGDNDNFGGFGGSSSFGDLGSGGRKGF